MWVKICGNTRLEDCLHAASCGADAVGFIFAPGKRTVTAEQIAPLTKQLPETLEKIGVFTTSNPEKIVSSALQAGLTGVQIHSAYDSRHVRAIQERAASARLRLTLIQVVTWDVTAEPAAQVDSLRALLKQIEQDRLVQRILIDSFTPQGSGGTGVPFAWEAAQDLVTSVRIPLILAGGLRPDNVARAIQTLHPLGVDVSSGVEHAPGVKSEAAVRAFIQNARTAVQPAKESSSDQ